MIGWTIVAGGFYFRIANYGAGFPVSAPYAAAVDLEMSWEFCSLGVAMTVIGWFKPAVTIPFAIFGAAIVTFLMSAVVSMLGRKIPKIGKWIFG